MNITDGSSFPQNAVQQRLILEAAKDYAIFTTDLQRRVTTWSVGAEAVFGYAEADIIGQPADILFVPEDCPHAPEYEFGKAQTEGRAENERWHRRQDGSRIYGSGVVTPLRDDTGTIVGLVKIMRDLTRQKQAEEALTKSEERFRAFVTATSDAVYRMSTDWQEMHQLVGKSFLPDTTNTNASWLEQYIPPQDQAGVRVAIGESIQAKKTFELEHRVMQADGNPGWTFSRVIPILNERGEIMEWFGTASDIAEHKRAEEALANSEEKYRTLFNSIDEGFCTVEVLFDEERNAVDYRFLENNPAFIRQTGLENAIGRTILELAPDHEPFWINTYGHIAKTGEAMRFEHPAAALGCYYDVYAFRIGESAEHRVAILFNNITERKRHEANLVFLAEVGQDLAGLTNIDETMNALGAKIGGYFKVADVVFSEVSDDEQTVHINHEWHRADFPTIKGTYVIKDYFSPEFEQFHRAGQIAIIRDSAHDERVDAAAYAALGIGTSVNMPLISQNKWRFNFALNDANPRDWRADEIELVRELITRIWTRLERARAEDSLRESEEKFRTLFNSIDEGVSTLEVIVDEQGKAVNIRYLENNPAVKKILGIELTVGKTAREVIPEIEEHWIDTVGSVARTGSPVRSEYLVKGLDRWISAYLLRVGGPDNRKVVAVYDDITERKRHEANLVFLAEVGQDLAGLTNIDETMNALGAKIGGYFKVADVVFSEVSDDEQTVHVNHEWHRADFPTMKGTYVIKDYFSPEFEQLHRAGQIAIIRDTAHDERVDAAAYAALGIGTSVNIPLISQNKWRFNFALNDANPRDWRADEIELVRELITRIWTRLERARAEECLYESEEKYRSLFEFMQQGFGIAEIIVNEAGHPTDYRMLEINRQFEKLTGQEREQYLDGRTVRQIAPELGEDWYAFYGNVALTGIPAHRDIRAEAWNRWFEVLAYQTGQPEQRRVAILYSEITERKQADERQRYLLKLSDVLRPLADPAELPADPAELPADPAELPADPAELCAGAMRVLGEHFGPVRALFWEAEPDGAHFVTENGHAGGMAPIAGRGRLADLGSYVNQQLTAGQTLVITDVAADPRVDKQGMAVFDAYQCRAYIGVPLIKRGRLLAILGLYRTDPYQWTAGEIGLVEETAERTWVAVERARSEAALRESQRFVQGIITSLPLVIYVFDLVERKNLYLSPQIAEVFGYTTDYIQTASPSLLPTYFHPDDLPAVTDYFEQIARSTADQVFSIECRMHHKERGWIWVVCRDIVYARDANGQPTQLLGTVEDVTGRREAEQTLRQSDDRFRTLVQNLPDYAIFQIDPDTIITEWTEGAQRMKGYTADEAIGQHLSLFYTPENLAAGELRDEVEEATRTGRAERESVRIRKGGQRFWVDEIITAIHDESGQLTGFTKISRDITERKKADEALFDSRQRLQIVLDSIADHAVITFDLRHRIVSWNPGARQMFGYTADEAIGQSGEIFFTPQDRAVGQMEHEMRMAREQGRAPDERYHLRKDGSQLYVSGAMAPLFDAGNILLGYVKVARDLTDRRQMEQALREADERKDEFLALLAHELRNPLATLSNTLLILNLTGGQTDDMSLPTATALMNREIAQLTRLVDDLLDVSRISRGKLTLSFGRLNLTTLVGQATEAVGAQFRAAKRQLSVSLPAEPLYMNGDAARLKQVVSNLLTNALKFTNDGGNVTVTLAQAGKESVLQVQDDGIGIPAHELGRIFEMFAQVDSSVGRSQGGLGLGLTLVSELVNLHGGRVVAWSGGDRLGSTFTVYLPLETTPEPDTKNPATLPPAPAAKRRVLVVDDNRDAATTLAMLLKLTGNEVHTRYDGRAGVAAADSLQPQVVILDISMPGMDGYQACRLIREQLRGKAMLLIALSGYGQEEDKRRSREAGFDAHLVKPVDLAVLKALLAAVPAG